MVQEISQPNSGVDTRTAWQRRHARSKTSAGIGERPRVHVKGLNWKEAVDRELSSVGSSLSHRSATVRDMFTKASRSD
jgi:hypothetical protein